MSIMQPDRILVTAALPYANGIIHLGHLAGAYLPADLYVRYQRLKRRDVLFICGSDEHGVAITITADKEHIHPQDVVDRYHEINRKAFERFGMSFDNYSRTSIPLHHKTTQEFFASFHAQGILREKTEQQFYDPVAKKFLPDRYVEGTCPVCGQPDARGDQCEKCGSYLNPLELKNPRSKLSGGIPEVRETSHWFFPLGEFQTRLEEYIREKTGQEEWKENVLNYCRGWFKDGLKDRAVTRDLDWGVRVPVPGYEQKVVYVWFDAVLGYITSTREWAERQGAPDAWQKYWLSPTTKYVAFIGKDNVVFHCIVFPAMLMAWNDVHEAQYVLPQNVPANEFLNFEGQKFSKSRGWGIDVDEFLQKFPADPLRYYLTMNLPEYRDSDFTWKEFQAKNNNELADIFGNFINRTLAFAVRTFNGSVPARGELQERDREMLDLARRTPAAAGAFMEGYHFRDALTEVMNLSRAANKYFNDSEPWKTAKGDPARCATAINVCTQVARTLAILTSPFIPATADRLWQMLNLGGGIAKQSWDAAGDAVVPDGHVLGTPGILVVKIEDEVIDAELGRLAQLTAAAPGAPAPVQDPAKPTITFDDFKKVDLRVGRIVAAERVPKSEKLLKLQVDIGTERRQVVAGIAQHYAPDDLIGKSIVVVYNLAPAKLMGQESQGMLLAASDASGKLVVISPSADIASGATVK
jgi:methionyl-tRNA synthetase